MKNTVTIVRFLVGALFIFSGLVKANDPLGLSYKMQEFFELWGSSAAGYSFLISLFDFLHAYSLTLSVLIITLEIIAGVALIVGWKPRLVVNLLLLLIIFFTFLTAYAYLSGKFKNCGCFGDCLPITPLASFLKDVLLLFLIGFLTFHKRHITPIFSDNLRWGVLAASLVATLGLQWYVLNYLPIADCLPFKKSNSIAQQMKMPAGAVPDSFAIRFVYEKGGKQFEFAPESLPVDLGSYTFVKRTDKMVRKGNAEPPIKGFSLTGISGVDSTNEILNLPLCFLLISEDLSKSGTAWIDDFKGLNKAAQERSVPVYIITSSISKALPLLQQHQLTNVPLFTCDYTAIRTAARTNPTLYRLRRGIIENKYSFQEIDQSLEKLGGKSL